jgi:hypothetical protein
VGADGPAHKIASQCLNSGLGIGPRREWPSSLKAPGGDVAQLLAVRGRTEKGEMTDVIEIRQPVKIEMEYKVIHRGIDSCPIFSSPIKRVSMRFQPMTWILRGKDVLALPASI